MRFRWLFIRLSIQLANQLTIGFAWPLRYVDAGSILT